MDCFLCKKKFYVPKVLCGHLKCVHGCERHSTYICTYTRCCQTFSDASTYKRHISKHLKQTVPIERETVVLDDSDFRAEMCTDKSYNVIYSKPTCNNTSWKFPTKPEMELEDTNILIFQNYITKNVCKFILSLHNNNNFCRKDVIFIVQQIQCLIIKPFHDILQTSDRNALNKILKICKNPFLNLETEYKFLKKMKDFDLYCDPLKFNLNSPLDAKVDSGAVMPLDFQFRKTFEDPVILDCALQEVECNDDSDLDSFTTSKLWAKKRKTYTKMTNVYLSFYTLMILKPTTRLALTTEPTQSVLFTIHFLFQKIQS